MKGHFMSHALLSFFIVPVPVEEGDYEERSPEYEICHGYHCGNNFSFKFSLGFIKIRQIKQNLT